MRLLHLLLYVIVGLQLPMTASATSKETIEIRSMDMEPEDHDPIRVDEMLIEADIAAQTVQFTLTTILRNQTDEDGNFFDEIEGEFILPLPTGAVINDFALDIEGLLVDGVLVEKEKARKTYTDKVTEGIDPGLAEMTNDNRYRVRIYPILEDDTRTIRLGFAAPATALSNWSLATEMNIADLSVNAPDYGLELKASDQKLNLTFNPPELGLKSNNSSILEHPVAGDFAVIHLSDDEIAKINTQFNSDPTTIAVIWDQSLSRQDSDVENEIAVIAAVLGKTNIQTAQLITGTDRILDREIFQGGRATEELLSKIKSIQYDGGSNIPSLLDENIIADICILVSDGKTIGDGEITVPDCPVFTISTSAFSDREYLQVIGELTGGRFVEFSNPSEMANQILNGSIPVITSQDMDFPRWLGSINDGLIIGRRQTNDRRVSFTIERPGQNALQIEKRLRGKTSHKGAPTLWAKRQAALLRSQGKSAADVIAFSPTLCHRRPRKQSDRAGRSI